MTAIRKHVAPWFKVVYARVDEEHVVERERRTDLGERPVMRVVPKGVAGMLSNHCPEPKLAELLGKAESYVSPSEGWRVYVYPSTERDPLGRAKREVVAGAPTMAPGTRSG